jgi:hypothetical protein
MSAPASTTGKPVYPAAVRWRSLRLWPQAAAFLLVVVELCWVVPWYRTLLRISVVAPVMQVSVVLGAVMYAAYLLGQAFERLRLVRNAKLGALVLLLILSLFASLNLLLGIGASRLIPSLAAQVPGAVLVLFFVVWLWWRGFSLAGEAIRPVVAARRFTQAIFFFLAHVLVSGRMAGETTSLGSFAFFLFAGLMTMVFARISHVGLSRGVRRNPFDRRWLGMTVAIVGASVALAILAGSLLTGQYRLLLDWLTEAIKVVLAVVIFIISLPGLFLSGFLRPLFDLLRRGMQQVAPLPSPTDVVPPGSVIPQEPLSTTAQGVIFWGLALLLLLLLFGVVYRRISGRQRKPGTDDEFERLLKQGEARQIVRRAMEAALADAAGRLWRRRRALASARIRGVYSQLLDLCAELNIPRADSQTPLEYQPRMGEIFPQHATDLEAITAAYNLVRYGELPESGDEVGVVEAAWRRVAEEGRRLRRAGVGKLKTAEVKDVERTNV